MCVCRFIKSLLGHVQRVYEVTWSADSRLLCSSSADSTIKVWDIVARKLLFDLPGHADEVSLHCHGPWTSDSAHKYFNQSGYVAFAGIDWSIDDLPGSCWQGQFMFPFVMLMRSVWIRHNGLMVWQSLASGQISPLCLMSIQSIMNTWSKPLKASSV